MKKLNLNFMILFIGIMSVLSLTGCQKEGCTDANANNYDPDAKKNDGSCLYPHVVPSIIQEGVYYLTGNGGSISESHYWNNSEVEASYYIESVEGESGSIQLVIQDADGNVVADEIVLAGDDIESCTNSGKAGQWTITINLIGYSGEAGIILNEGC